MGSFTPDSEKHMSENTKQTEEANNPPPPEFHSSPLKMLGFFGSLKLIGIVLGTGLSLVIWVILLIALVFFILLGGFWFLIGLNSH